jgi:hypothetical protein
LHYCNGKVQQRKQLIYEDKLEPAPSCLYKRFRRLADKTRFQKDSRPQFTDTYHGSWTVPNAPSLSTGRCRCVRYCRFDDSSTDRFKSNEHGHVTRLQACIREGFEFRHEHLGAPGTLSDVKNLSSIDDVSYTRDRKTRQQHVSNILRRLWYHFPPDSHSCFARSRSSQASVSHLLYTRLECSDLTIGKQACKSAPQHRCNIPTISIRLQSISKLAMSRPTPFTQMAQMRPIVILLL